MKSMKTDEYPMPYSCKERKSSYQAIPMVVSQYRAFLEGIYASCSNEQAQARYYDMISELPAAWDHWL